MSMHEMAREGCILIIDDHEAFRETLGEILESHGYQTLRAGSADEAADLLSAHEVDHLIVDFRMPGMNGCEIVERLSQKARMPTVVYLTAYPEAVEACLGGTSRRAPVFTKPPEVVDLLGALRKPAA